MKFIRCEDFQNDSTDTHSHAAIETGDFGDEQDEAFRLGRECANKGYTKAQAYARKHKSKACRDAFRKGFQWQQKRNRS